MGLYTNNTDSKIIGQKLDSFKKTIEFIVNKFFESKFKYKTTKEEINNWKNDIINLINKEIDKLEFDLQKINNDLNKKESKISEEQIGQITGFKTQIEESQKSILNQNKKSSDDKSLSNNFRKVYEKRQIDRNKSRVEGLDQANVDINKKNNKNLVQNMQQYVSKCSKSNIRNITQTKPEDDSRFNQNMGQNSQDKGSKLIIRSNIYQNKRLDIFCPKNIQEENEEIIRTFLKEIKYYNNYKENIKNENIGYFLIKVANISRKAYNNSNELFINMFKEFSKIVKEEKVISDLKNDEQLRKEFSSWVKEYEKEPEGKKKYENYFNSFKGKGKYAKEDYTSILLSQLTILYFHCELSFPIVEVDFNSESLFNHEKMIDFINKGINRKVDFVILPSLFSNGNYLENGKLWVFTYKKDTFKFGKIVFETLVNKQEKFNRIYPKNNLQNFQTRRGTNLLRNQTNTSNNSNNSNINHNPREKEIKYYKCPINKNKTILGNNKL